MRRSVAPVVPAPPSSFLRHPRLSCPSPRLSSAGWNPGGRQATRWGGVAWGAFPVCQRRYRHTPFPPSFQRRLESRWPAGHAVGGGGVGRAPHLPTSASPYALPPVFPAQAGIQRGAKAHTATRWGGCGAGCVPRLPTPVSAYALPPVFPAQAGIQRGAKAHTATRWGGVAWGALPIRQRRHRHTPPGFQPPLERRGRPCGPPLPGTVERKAAPTAPACRAPTPRPSSPCP